MAKKEETTTMGMLEDILDRENLNLAYRRVRGNNGAPGVDDMTARDLLTYYRQHRKEIHRTLMDGTYRPRPVLRVEIPKDNGTKRQLGIPVVLDRLIQQAIAQVLSKVYEPLFSDTSYGFRPKRSAIMAIDKCKEYLNAGRCWTVDMDLEKFFDTVNHDRLLQLLSVRIRDGRVISLISRFLNAGAMVKGRRVRTPSGVPQGGPLSPLLANVMLNELDHELERRGHRFVRYADDMVICCGSKASAQQALDHIIPYIEGKLLLKVNREKTVVAKATDIKFLGFGFYISREPPGTYASRIHQRSLEKLKDKVRRLTTERRAGTFDKWVVKFNRVVRGWANYFGHADSCNPLRDVDSWTRRRIRAVLLDRWKLGKTKEKRLMQYGLNVVEAKCIAYSPKGTWRLSATHQMHKAITNGLIKAWGFLSFLECAKPLRRHLASL